MLGEFIEYAFAAGEISPTLYGRTDLEKYDLALAEAINFFVDYRGGISSRFGSEFCDYVLHDDKPTKFVPFAFAPAVDTTYNILFGHQYIRFIQDGAYIVEAAKVITGITKANPGVVTSVGHGFTTGDWVKIFDVVGMTRLNGMTFQVGTTTANTFQLLDPLTGANYNTSTFAAYVSGGNAYRIYTVVSPYDADDLELLNAHQARSVITLTHQEYDIRELTRFTDISWTLSTLAIDNGVSKPTGVAITPSAAGTAGVAFAVTAIDANGVESVASAYAFNALCVNYAATAGSAKVTWTEVAGAVRYNIYRSQIIAIGADISRAMQVGFVGTAYGPSFTDNNIIPDYTHTPPDHYDPFANGAVRYIEVTAGGAGYTRAAVVSATIGTGLVAYPVVDGSGVLLGIVVVNGGKNYTSASVVSVTVGAGATFNINVTAASGNAPGESTLFEQRRVFAGPSNNPLRLNGSKPKQYSNFDSSLVVESDDSYEFDVDSAEVSPIRHLIPTRSGLIVMSQAAIWQVSGGRGTGATSNVITPTNAQADEQSHTGASNVKPLQIDTDILYTEGKGSTTRLLVYDSSSRVFGSQDMSLFANHLVSPSNPIKVWAWASDPSKLVYGVREDGVMLNLTLVKDQNVAGWTRQQTQGLYTDVLVLQENSVDSVYYMVQRYINSRWTKFIERQKRREFTEVEDCWCVDCALEYPKTYPAADLTLSAATGSITLTASAAVFALGNVGSIIRAGGGKMEITAYTNATHVTATVLRDITSVIPEDENDIPLPVLSGDWTMDAPTTSVSGLDHLEGATVSILADGNVLTQAVVTNGAVALGGEYTRVVVGLPYRCKARSLPPTSTKQTIEGKVKRVVRVQPRVYQSRGLQVGTDLDLLESFKERSDEPMGEPTRLQEGVKEVYIEASYEPDQGIYFIEDDPIPTTVLGFLTLTDIGDE